MLIAFISDIHGNFDALKAVIRDINKKKIKKVYCLGDIVNYYYEPHKCIELLIKNKIESVCGNHEKIFLKTLKNKKKNKYFSKLYGNSIFINLKKLNKKHIFFLKSLKNRKIIKIKNQKILLTHGAPWKNSFYFYPNLKKKWFQKISKYRFNIIVLGHTHYPMIIKLKKKMILANPGSVGQPRNNSTNASWMVLDTKNMLFYHKKTQYNKTKLKKQIKKHDPNNLKLLKYFKK